MRKKITTRRESPFGVLIELPGVKRNEIDAYYINHTSDIEPILESGSACTAAGGNGAINVWKDDAGVIRGALMCMRRTVEKRIFASYAEAEKCVEDWLEKIE